MGVEKVTDEQVTVLADKVASMTAGQIDEFWSLCGWSEEDRRSNNALSDSVIEWIKTDGEYRHDRVSTLLQECGAECINEALAKIRLP